MRAQIAIAVACAAAAMTITVPAEAKGCLKGAAVGGVAGHVAGHHGLLGAGAGCLVGRHRANKAASREQQEQAVSQQRYDNERTMGGPGTQSNGRVQREVQH